MSSSGYSLFQRLELAHGRRSYSASVISGSFQHVVAMVGALDLFTQQRGAVLPIVGGGWVFGSCGSPHDPMQFNDYDVSFSSRFSKRNESSAA